MNREAEGFEAPVESAGSGIGLGAMPAPRRAVVEHLKRAGEATAEAIAEAVGVTVGAVRQQLAVLDASYRAALEEGYLWHEFGDSHLILP